MSTPQHVTIACLKLQTAVWQPAENLRRLQPMIAEAARLGADIVVTPECALSGYAVHKDRPIAWTEFLACCEPIDGARVQQVAGWAREYGVFVALGFPELRAGRRYNTCALFDRRGNLVGTYSKTHLGYIPENVERELFEAGDQLPIFETELGRIGMLICMDRWFPEAAQVLALQHAQIILMPSASNPTRAEMQADAKLRSAQEPENDQKEYLFRARASDCGCAWAEAHAFKSLIVSPTGRIVARGNYANAADEVVIGTVEVGECTRQRELVEAVRRPELYGRVAACG